MSFSESDENEQYGLLPEGEEELWSWDLPACARELIGWRVMALFAEHNEQPLAERMWHAGVIVRYDDQEDDPFIIYYGGDDVPCWERVGLPDRTIVFRLGSEDRAAVSANMLPGTDSDLA